MPGMMRSRVTGCQCQDCSGGWSSDRASEKRQVAAEIEEGLVIHRFGLDLTPAAFERLGEALDRISAAERRAYQ